jgi:aryl-alcohol dehydrogenase-like predicted oxidoreductase
MTFGEDLGGGFGASVEDSEAILAHYLEQGGNFIDTANAYTLGTLREDHRGATGRKSQGA